MNVLAALDGVLSKLNGDKKGYAHLNRDLRLAERGEPIPMPADEPSLFRWIAITAVAPGGVGGEAPPVPDLYQRFRYEALLERWAARVCPTAPEVVGAWLQALPHAAPVGMVAAHLDAGDPEAALALVEQIPRERKWARAMATMSLVEAGRASLEDAVRAALSRPWVETGPERGGAELYALGAVLARALRLGEETADIEAQIVKLAHAGQQGARPSRFANDLADIAVQAAETAAPGRTDGLDVARRLLAGVEHAGAAQKASEKVKKSEALVAAGRPAGEHRPGPVRNKVSGPRPGWMVLSEFKERAQEAVKVMAIALDRGDLEAYFDAVCAVIQPRGETQADRVARWRKSLDVADLITAIRADETPADWWYRPGFDPWADVHLLQDVADLREVLALYRELDLIPRSYAAPHAPRSMALPLVQGLARSPEGRELALQVLEELAASTLEGSDCYVAQVLEVLEASGMALHEVEPHLPASRYNLLWVMAGTSELGMDTLEARLGEPHREVILMACKSLLRAGRIDEAIARTACPHDDGRGGKYWPPRAAPTQAACLLIAKEVDALTRKQKSALRKAMKDAPRRPRAGHTRRKAELKALLDAMPTA